MKKTTKLLLFCTLSLLMPVKGYTQKSTDTVKVKYTYNISYRNDSVNDNKDVITVIKVLENGDTVYTYKHQAFDYGDISKQAPTFYTYQSNTPNRVSVSNKSLVSLARVQSVDQSKSVGKIPFSEGITPSGGRTYSIPIPQASGISLSPQIALSYNSQTGNGVAGYGWNISGLSSITVTGKNIYYDNTPAPVDLSKPSECVFMLDGTRLIANTGSLTEYQYETAQGFVLVQKQLAGNGNIACFTAKFPNGTTARFGFTNNTEMRYSYPVTQLEDVRGNKINFEYTQSGNNYYISKIKYGGKAEDTHLAEIHFNYISRTDFATAYIGGIGFSADLLLKSIVSYNKVNGNLEELRIYTLTHILNEVQQLTQLDCSIGASSLNPLTFDYNTSSPGNQAEQLYKETNLSLSNYFSSTADIKPVFIRGKFIKNKFNDGLITFPGKFSPYGITGYLVKKVLWWETKRYASFGSTYPPNQQILIAPGLSFGSDTKEILTEEGFQTIQPADINGDGVDEIVKVNFGGISFGSIPFTINPKTILKITKYAITDGNLSSQSFTVPITGIVSNEGETYSPISMSYYFGDFSGTGKTQLLAVTHNKDALNNDRTSYFALIDIEQGTLIKESTLFGHSLSDQSYIQTLDINSDGKTDLCRATDSGLEVYSLSGNDFVKVFTDPVVTKSVFYKDELYGDLNGDGKVDILVPPTVSYQNKQYNEIPVWAPHQCPICGGSEPIINSYNNLCRHCNNDIKAYYTSNNYNQAHCHECSAQLQSCGSNSDPNYPSPGYPGGGTDNLCCPNHGQMTMAEIDLGYVDNGNIWTAYLSTGKGFVKTELPIINTEGNENYTLFDINNDGYADLLQVKNNQVTVRLSKNSFIQSTPTGYAISIPSGSKIIPASIRDFSSMSHFICVENADVSCYRFARDESKARLLTTLTDSYGVRYTNEYADMTGRGYSSNYIPTSTSRSYPYTSFIAPLNLLSSTTVYKDNSQIANNYYAYFGAVLHRTGLGFCGFEKVKTIDFINNITTEEEKNPELFGVTTRVTSPLAEASYSYSANMDYSTKKANPYMYYASETDKLKNITQTKSYSYDAYNNPTRVSVSSNDNEATSAVTTQTYAHTVTPALYLVGLPLVKTVTATRSGQSWTGKDEITYNAARLPQTRVTYTGANGDKKTGETRWEYDGNGNVTSEKATAYNNTLFLGKTYTYDPTGRYALSETNALNQTTTYGGFDKYGNPAAVTDYKGHTTTHTFDVWGQPVSTTYPDGVTENVTAAWGGAGLYTVTKTATGKPTVIAHYDALGREIRAGNQRFDGQWQYVDKVYDARGRIEKTSLPYRTNATLWNTYTYDAYNRPLTLTEASGKVTSWSYNGRSVTETRNGIASTKTQDAGGVLTDVTDPGGTIHYVYRADGQPAGIMADGVPTSFGYDDYGRKTSITDPSAGTQTFTETYTNNRKTTTVTDANGKTITTRYDEYGRVTAVERPEFNTAYTYNADGQIISEASTNGTDKTYQYDNLGRVTVQKETVPDGKWLQKTYTYAAGSVVSLQYTTQEGAIATENYTYAYGHLTETKLNGQTTLWKLTAENDLGQPTQAQTGPLARTYGYTPYGMPTGRTAGSLQNFSYNFDPLKGNLLSRTDNTRNLTETFGYDNLNRLASINGNNIVYEANGNITTMPGTGTMTYYNIDKPYAVTGLAPAGNTVPMREQHVTYTSFQRPNTLTENNYVAAFTYNASGERIKMEISNEGYRYLTQYYLGEYETDNDGGLQILYLGGDAYSAPAVLIKRVMNPNWKIYYICRDYLGSITHITDGGGYLTQELSYDAWGKLRDPGTQIAYAPDNEPELFLRRGYTGHEHLTLFGLINMNARLYDPALGRFLSPDPYVQAPDFTQNFNRYSYCLNNPLVYVDQDGEFFWIPIIIGAVIGAYTGGVLANNGEYNLFKWDYSSGKTWGYMFGGAVVGGLAGLTGGAIAGSGIPMANTAAIAGSSLINSVGTWAYTGGQTPISISLGVASYDFTNNKWGYLGKKGNSVLENIGYGFGALANLPDIISLFSGGGTNVDLIVEKKDAISHSALVGENEGINISVGPYKELGEGINMEALKSGTGTIKELTRTMKGKIWENHATDGNGWKLPINNVSKKILSNMSNKLQAQMNNKTLSWNLLGKSCVGYTSRALWSVGIPNLGGIHPYWLQFQMIVRQTGIYSSPYLYQIP